MGILVLSSQIISCGSAENSNNQIPETNSNLVDSDFDGIPDASDPCPRLRNAKVNLSTDTDLDGVMDECEDIDSDGIADGIDNCPRIVNPDQKDSNHNGVGDSCADIDRDGDGIQDDMDECPFTCTISSLPYTFVDDDGITKVIDVCPQVLGKIDSDGNKVPDNEPAYISTCPIF